MNKDEIKASIERLLPDDENEYELENECACQILYNKVCRLLRLQIVDTCYHYMQTSLTFDFREYCDSLSNELEDLLSSSTFIDEDAQKIADECLRRVNEVFDIKPISNGDEAKP